MKKMLLCIAVGIAINFTAQAVNSNSIQNDEKGTFMNRRNVQPVLFTYDNVDYALFPDGRLDFELNNNTYNYRSSRNTVANFRTYGRRVSYTTAVNRSSYVRYNNYGQVVLIGDTRISYFRNGQVARIGQLDVDYKQGFVKRVGDLKVRYDRYNQIIAARGHVNNNQHFDHDHDCSIHNFGSFEDDDNRDWDNGIYFKRGGIK